MESEASAGTSHVATSATTTSSHELDLFSIVHPESFWGHACVAVFCACACGRLVSCPDPASFNGGIGSGHFWPKAGSTIM